MLHFAATLEDGRPAVAQATKASARAGQVRWIAPTPASPASSSSSPDATILSLQRVERSFSGRWSSSASQSHWPLHSRAPGWYCRSRQRRCSCFSSPSASSSSTRGLRVHRDQRRPRAGRKVGNRTSETVRVQPLLGAGGCELSRPGRQIDSGAALLRARGGAWTAFDRRPEGCDGADAQATVEKPSIV